MKLHWGKGIVLGFVAFIAFILYFVITMSTNKEYAHDLVTDDYYKKELGYQQEIDAQQNAKTKGQNLAVTRVKEGLIISFPRDADIEEIKGNVFLYRPSNKLLDFNVPIVLSSTNMLIPNARLLDGRWNITVNWQYKAESYQHNERIML